MSKEVMQTALDALTRWQQICIANNRSARELTIATKAINSLNEALNSDDNLKE